MPILDWLLREHCPDYSINGEWADLYRLRRKPKSLSERIEKAIDFYPCDILFIHRDAEGESREFREHEIDLAFISANLSDSTIPHICVVPVRMQEAWLLFDEGAIRKASGNPNGRVQLDLPRPQRIENLSDPKYKLRELLLTASGKSGRHLDKVERHLSQHIHRVPENINDFSPLRDLPAFQALENQVRGIIPILALL